MSALAWHYTIGERFDWIIAAGILQPSCGLLARHERPVVWFSLNQRFEPTAHKGKLGKYGEMLRMDWREMRDLPGELVRFGRPPRLLLNGDRLRQAARIPREIWHGLERAGRKQGADPADWFGHVGPLPIDGLVIEFLDHEGRWVERETFALAA